MTMQMPSDHAENAQKESFHITFSKSRDFKMVPVTGVCGGANPIGEIVCSFFVEQKKLPDKLILTVDSKTAQIKESISDVNDNEYVRELQTALVMRPDVALSVGQWLIREAKKIIPQQNSDGSE